MEKSAKRRKYDAAFRAEALRVAAESRSVPAAACSLNLRPELLYKWRQAAQPALPAYAGETAEVRQLRTANRRLTQELEILKKAIAICSTTPTT